MQTPNANVIPDRKTQFQTASVISNANVMSNADTKYEWPMYNNRTGVTISDRVVTVLNQRASPVPAPPTWQYWIIHQEPALAGGCDQQESPQAVIGGWGRMRPWSSVSLVQILSDVMCG
jgi:hypothetical protein